MDDPAGVSVGAFVAVGIAAAVAGAVAEAVVVALAVDDATAVAHPESAAQSSADAPSAAAIWCPAPPGGLRRSASTRDLVTSPPLSRPVRLRGRITSLAPGSCG